MTTTCPREVPPKVVECPKGCGFIVPTAAKWRLDVHLRCKPSTCRPVR